MEVASGGVLLELLAGHAQDTVSDAVKVGMVPSGMDTPLYKAIETR